jgi:hypothetical protein
MLASAHELVRGSIDRQCAFRLLHCGLGTGNGFMALREFENPPHDQWRLFHRRLVKYKDAIHTPGFDFPNGTVMEPDIFFVHLQWVVKTYEERREKIISYDLHAPNAGTGWKHYYLVEDNPKALATAYPVSLPEFCRVAQELTERFPTAVQFGKS